MLLARAPVRISFAGGGTDLEDYYSCHGGMVVSAAIDKYFYVFVNANDGDGVHIGSSDYRCFHRWSGKNGGFWDGDLLLPQAILDEFNISQGLSIFLASEIPPGTGLGSSSTVATALIKALSTLDGQRLTPAQIAELAYQVESVKLGRPCGKQDQYAASFGGLNAIYFQSEGARVEPLNLDFDTQERLRERLLLFFLGSSRNAGDIGSRQRQATREGKTDVVEALHYLKDAAIASMGALESGRLELLGEVLRESWERKKRLAKGVSNPHIDEIYERALEKGAVGGKVTGAGGGGFLLLYCEPQYREQVCREMESLRLYRMDFHFDMAGARVLMNSVSGNGHAAPAHSLLYSHHD
jgi:D-glycero-alpha-D-manno-heptose-7-phosphate kinase